MTMTITLNGKSKKGKTIIANAGGNEYELLEVRASINTAIHKGLTGPFMLVKNTTAPESTKYNIVDNTSSPHFEYDLRWISETDDPDFELADPQYSGDGEASNWYIRNGVPGSSWRGSLGDHLYTEDGYFSQDYIILDEGLETRVLTAQQARGIK